MIDLNKEYNNSKEYFQALVETEHMWEWLCDNPNKDKDDYPKFKSGYKNDCHICTCRRNFSLTKHIDICCDGYFQGVGYEYNEEFKWSPCILSILCETYHRLWEYNTNIESRRKYAEKIYFKVLDERLKRM